MYPNRVGFLGQGDTNSKDNNSNSNTSMSNNNNNSSSSSSGLLGIAMGKSPPAIASPPSISTPNNNTIVDHHNINNSSSTSTTSTPATTTSTSNSSSGYNNNYYHNVNSLSPPLISTNIFGGLGGSSKKHLSSPSMSSPSPSPSSSSYSLLSLDSSRQLDKKQLKKKEKEKKLVKESSATSLLSFTNNSNHLNNNHNNVGGGKKMGTDTSMSMLERNKVGLDDLSEFKEFDEDTLINNLQVRFKKNIIYTNVGPILVSINPYQKLSIYTTDILNIYKQRNGVRLPPHLFQVAEKAYMEMVDYHKNQIICISGESGSGKSENNKLIIQYLLGANTKHKRTNIENLILECGSILESFGHCATVSNHNSSRFGKYIEIYYSYYGEIKGARVFNYFLDESRVAIHNKGERNFHIFYQFLLGANEDEKMLYNLDECSSYQYLNQGGVFSLDDVDDALKFDRLRMAFSFFDLTSAHIDLIFRTLSFILNLGNLSFVMVKSKVDVKDRQYLENISNSISFDSNKLEFIFIPDKNTTTIHEAIENRDSLAKSLYANLFQWIVDILNLKLAPEKSADNSDHLIGILDLFGQENTQLNGYEQFSINFLEEQLQQIYIQNILKCEQEDYKRERIPWNYPIAFRDNSESLELVEKIVNLLDQESKNLNSNDVVFLEKLNLFLGKHHLYYIKQKKFGIEHFFGSMSYDIKGFIQKNRDEIYQKSSNLYKNSIIKLFADNSNPALKTSRKTPLSIIKSLPQSSNFHFIKCLRPNSKKLSGNFESKIVNEQIKNACLVETTKIQKFGYTINYPLKVFADRFPFLYKNSKGSSFANTGLIDKMKENGIQTDSILPPYIQMGATKVFLRFSLATLLEIERQKRRYNGAITIQKNWRMYRDVKAYRKMKKATVTIQKCTRRWLVQRRYLSIRAAIVILESFSRMVIQRLRFLKLKESSISLQCTLRGLLAKNYVNQVQKIYLENQQLQLQNNNGQTSIIVYPPIPQSLLLHMSPCSTPPTSPTIFYMKDHHHHHHQQHEPSTSTTTTTTTTNNSNLSKRTVRFSEYSSGTSTPNGDPTTPTTTTNRFIKPTNTTLPSTRGGIPPLRIGSIRKEINTISPTFSPSPSPSTATPSESPAYESPPQTPPISPKKDLILPNNNNSNNNNNNNNNSSSNSNTSSSSILNSNSNSSSKLTNNRPPPINIHDRPNLTSTKSTSSLTSPTDPFIDRIETPTSSSSKKPIGSTSSGSGSSPKPPQPSPRQTPTMSLFSGFSSGSSGNNNNSNRNRDRPYSLNVNSRRKSSTQLTSGGNSINSSSSSFSSSFSEPISPNKEKEREMAKINPISPRMQSTSPRTKQAADKLSPSSPSFIYFPSTAPSVNKIRSISTSPYVVTRKPELVPPQLPIYRSTMVYHPSPLNDQLKHSMSPRRRSKSILVKQSDAEEFEFIEYAKQNFEQRSKKSIIRKKSVSFDILVSFEKKLTSSLHRLDPNLEKIALEIFTHILMYMGDQERKKSQSAIAIFIIKHALENTDLRDEVYCQILKQMNNNPKKDSRIKGWELLCICCGSFAPNQRLLKYISSYLSHRGLDDDGYASQCFVRLQAISTYGARALPPVEPEIEAIKRRLSLKVIFLFSDDVGEPLEVDSTTTAGEITEKLMKLAGLRSDSHVAAVYEIFKNKERSLRKSEFILDVVSKWESYYQSVNQYNISHGVSNSETISLEPFQFCFKIQLFLKPNRPIANQFDQHILFHQLIKGISKSHMPIKEQDLCKIASLRIWHDIQCGSNISLLNHNDIWQRYVPEKLLMVHSSKEWADMIIEKYNQYANYLKLLGKEDLKFIIVNFIMSLPFYGSTLFMDCVQDQWSEIEITAALDGFHVAIDVNGVHIISKQSIDINSGKKDNLQDSGNSDGNLSQGNTPRDDINQNNNNSNNITTSGSNQNSPHGITYEVNENDSHANIIESFTKILIGKNNNRNFKVIQTFHYSHILQCDVDPDAKTLTLTVDQEDLLIQSPQCSEMGVLINGYTNFLSADSKCGVALQDYTHNESFSFKKGDVINIINKGEDGWCTGYVNNTPSNTGAFPLDFLQLIINPPSNEIPPLAATVVNRSQKQKGRSKQQSTAQQFTTKVVEVGSKHPLMPYAINRFRSLPALKLGDSLKHTSNVQDSSIFIADLPIEFQKEIELIFIEIMKYMGEYPLPPKEHKSRLLQNIIQRCINKPKLRDEIYFFICRQLTLNPSFEGIRKGMVLFSLCAGCFPATAELFPYLRQFLTQIDNQYSNYCIKKLQATALKGPRLFGPSKKEIHAVKEKRYILCKIHLANGPIRQIEIGPSTTANEALKVLAEQLDLTYWKEFAIYKDWNGKEHCLKDHEKLADIMKLFEDKEKKARKLGITNNDEEPIVGRLVLLRKLWIPHTSYSMSNGMLELMFYQCVHDVLVGKMPGLTIELSLTLASLQLQAQEGDHNADSPMITEETVSLCIPATLIDKMDLSDWVVEINKAHSQLASKSITPAKALTMYLEQSSSFPFSGTSWFSIHVKRNHGPMVWIGINQNMIVMFDEKMENEIARWAIEEVSGFTYREDSFSFLIGDLINPTRKLFYTELGDEINEIFEVFKSLPKVDLVELERRKERKRERKEKEERKRKEKEQQQQLKN